ncbi:hypothetical protein WICPIJ_001106 [Wickerhamomyces pijperi]|uniref:Secreted protein n=1 Tax=Wickerhamomyces pijperi TaxID=599730 RepID=A0A9P8TR32_WICPI|nr:hypothetical protein WICPIJ_001106 [Wickerhamomyces pijperi]
MNEAIGLLSLVRPALCNLTASAMAWMASSWPTTLSFSEFSMYSKRSMSPLSTVSIGIPVILDITLEMSSAETDSWSKEFSFCSSCSLRETFFSSSGILEYLSSEALPKLPSL